MHRCLVSQHCLKVTQPEKESAELGTALNPQAEDTFLAGKPTANLSPSNSKFMPHSTHKKDIQTVLEDLDRDLSKFDLPLTENNSYNIPSQNITTPTSSHNILKTQYPTSHPKCHTTSSHNTHAIH